MSSFPKNATHWHIHTYWGQEHTASVKHCCPHSPDSTQKPALIQYQYSICRWPLLPPALMWINSSRLVLTEWPPPIQRAAHAIITGSASHWSWILLKDPSPLSEALGSWLVDVYDFIFSHLTTWLGDWGHWLLSKGENIDRFFWFVCLFFQPIKANCYKPAGKLADYWWGFVLKKIGSKCTNLIPCDNITKTFAFEIVFMNYTISKLLETKVNPL